MASGRLVDVKRTVQGEHRSVDGQGASGLVWGRDRVAGGDGRTAPHRRRGRVRQRPAFHPADRGSGRAVGDRRARTGGRDADGASTADIEDADGISGAAFAFLWVSIDRSADADIAGATDASYTLADSDSDAGSAVKVRVTFTDEGGHEETLASAATEMVAPRLPPLTAEFRGVPDEHDWAEDEPAEDALDLDVSPTLVDATRKPRSEVVGSGFVRAGSEEYPAVEDAGGDSLPGARARVEALAAFLGTGPAVVPRPHDVETVPRGLRETAAVRAAVGELRGRPCGRGATRSTVRARDAGRTPLPRRGTQSCGSSRYSSPVSPACG